MKNWRKIAHFMPEGENLYLVILCVHEFGITNIEKNTGLKVTEGRIIPERWRFFSEDNPIFNEEKREKILGYCEKVGSPLKGWGGCESNVVFYSRAPNSTIPIFWKDVDGSTSWRGLFKRHYDD